MYIALGKRRGDQEVMWGRLFYGCSYMFHLSGNNRRDRDRQSFYVVVSDRLSDADGGVVGSRAVCDNVGSEVVGDTGGVIESMYSLSCSRKCRL